MQTLSAIAKTLGEMKDFFWPSYQPERHYMRGPGPACAKRNTGVS